MYLQARHRTGRDAQRNVASGVELAQLFLDLEGEVEGQQEDLAPVDRATLVGGKGREVVPDGDDGNRLCHPMHRGDVGQLRPVTVVLQVAQHRRELAGMESVRIGERQQQRLKIGALRGHLRRLVRDRAVIEVTLARERVDRVPVLPGLRRHGRVRQVAVDEDARRALQAAEDERGQHAIARQQDPLVGLVHEQMLVRDRQLVREAQRRLGRVETCARQRMRCPRVFLFQQRPEHPRRRPVTLGELEPARLAHRDAVDGRERVPDDACCFDRVALQRLVQPLEYLRRPGFRRVRGARVERRQGEREGHGGSGCLRRL